MKTIRDIKHKYTIAGVASAAALVFLSLAVLAGVLAGDGDEASPQLQATTTEAPATTTTETPETTTTAPSVPEVDEYAHQVDAVLDAFPPPPVETWSNATAYEATLEWINAHQSKPGWFEDFSCETIGIDAQLAVNAYYQAPHDSVIEAEWHDIMMITLESYVENGCLS